LTQSLPSQSPLVVWQSLFTAHAPVWHALSVPQTRPLLEPQPPLFAPPVVQLSHVLPTHRSEVQSLPLWQLPATQVCVLVLQMIPLAAQSASAPQASQWLPMQASPALAPTQSLRVAQFPLTHAPPEQTWPVEHCEVCEHAWHAPPMHALPLVQSALVPHEPCTHCELALQT
jgi:hypothetical protein